ncbi:MAG TPA: hypothetical protein GXX35_07875 [Thermoanaerobacterales bacterium]|nr:hypothetical protein [Thermoanaerobacterales bacterium]
MAFIIGAAGTAKNTGKTTTTSAILDELYRENILIGLTSIGYDGEEVDNITGLPKPRLFLKKGSIVATAEKCLAAGSAEYKIMESTDIVTPLGKIMIVKITEDGLVVIAGPNKSSELRCILNMMTQNWKCEFIMVDGALNRIAPMVETDGIILATGAARNTDIDELVSETWAYCELFNLPEVSAEEKNIIHEQTKICLIKHDDIIKTLDYGSLIDKKSVDSIKEHIKKITTIYIPALLSENMLRELNQTIGSLWDGKILIVRDPIKIAAGGNPQNVICEISTLLNSGGKIKVFKKMPILAISVNPFYPLYRYENNNYEAGFVDADELFSKMKKAVPVPVVDVKRQGVNVLISLIKTHF